MAVETFDLALSIIFRVEGGFANRSKKADPGGPTNHGITQATLAAWRDEPVTIDDVRNLTREEASQIYKIQYWDAIKGDQLPAGLDFALCDFAVHSGPGRAIRELQKILGVDVDGVIGINTLKAIKKQSAQFLCSELCIERIRFMKGLRNYAYNKNGWTSRVRHVQEVSLELARGSKDVDPKSDKHNMVPVPKAKPDDIKPSTVAVTPEAISAVGGVLSALGGMAAGSGPVQWALGAAVVLSAAVGAYYLIHRIKQGEI